MELRAEKERAALFIAGNQSACCDVYDGAQAVGLARSVCLLWKKSYPKRFSQLSKEYRKLEKIVDVYKQYKNCLDSIAFGKEVLEMESDEELRAMAKEDLVKTETQKEELEETIRQLLIPKDPQDEKNVVMEIRAGR